jgi:NADPH:quinone reductase-like Zn-dependent oxidoreductase
MSNQAAWIMAEKGKPLEVESSPEPSAGPGQIVIKTRAVAVNPVDWKIQVKVNSQ